MGTWEWREEGILNIDIENNWFTHAAMFLVLVVGQLDFLKRDHVLGEAGEGRVGVHEHFPGRRGVGVSRHKPRRVAVRVAVPFVVQRCDIHEHHVLVVGVQVRQGHPHGGEHSPGETRTAQLHPFAFALYACASNRCVLR